MKTSLIYFFMVFLILITGCGHPVTSADPVSLTSTVTTTTITSTATATQTAAVTVYAPGQSTVQPGTKPGPVRTTPKSGPTPSPLPAPSSATPAPLKTQTVLNLGMMVHLEGWNDGVEEERFQLHAKLIREYASLFEKYGARLTLESKETTQGSLNWSDNILLEMQQRGHGIGIHADVGGNASETTRQMQIQLTEMKSAMDPLGVAVRHVSGVSSRCDWVTACADSGFQFVTGTVAFALASLPQDRRPIEIPPNAQPGQFHEAYPFTLEGRLHAWRAENGLNWITDNPSGRIVIIPSGSGLAYTYEESQGQSGLAGDQDFRAEDISAFEVQLKDILAYIQSDQSTQPYTYYLSWSLGKAFDLGLLEAWLQMVDKYVKGGQVRWQTIPAMYDDYRQWEIDSGRRQN